MFGQFRNRNHRGQIRFLQGQYSKAEECFRQALSLGKESYGEEHPAISRTLINLAQTLRQQGKLDEGERLLKPGCRTLERRPASDRLGTAVCFDVLAAFLLARGEVAEAKRSSWRSLSLVEEVYGKDHPNVATSLNNLALRLQACDKSVNVYPLYQRALAITEKTQGPNHPEVAAILQNLGALAQGGRLQAGRTIVSSGAWRLKECPWPRTCRRCPPAQQPCCSVPRTREMATN